MIPEPNSELTDILGKLDREVYARVLQGQSALQIALTDTLGEGLGNWYEAAVTALQEKLANRSAYVQASSILRCTRYASKIVWFRIAFEEYRGDNFYSVFTRRLNITREDLVDFAREEPFPFRNGLEFRKRVWCLRFNQVDGVVLGLTSFTARALRVIDDLDLPLALDGDLERYKQMEYGQDVCGHIRLLLQDSNDTDFRCFVEHMKNSYAVVVNLPSWLQTVCTSARRVLAGFRHCATSAEAFVDFAVGLDNSGNLVVAPPRSGDFDEDAFSNGDRFVLRCKDASNAHICWRYVDGVFDNDGHASVKVGCLSSISFQKTGQPAINDGLLKWFSSDSEDEISLFNVRPDSGKVCGYSLVGHAPVREELRECEYYKLTNLQGVAKAVVAFSADFPEGRLLDKSADIFHVPQDTLEIRIGKTIFQIADSHVDRLVHGKEKLACVRNSHGGPVGYRFYYNKTTYPLSDTRNIMRVWYEFNGCRVQIPVGKGNGWCAKESFLWQKNGKLIIESVDRPSRSFPVTFVDIDFTGFDDPPFEFGESRQVQIRLGMEYVKVTVGRDDAEVTVKSHDILFCPKVNRRGVQVELEGKTLVIPQMDYSQGYGVNIAYDDIVNGTATLVVRAADVQNLFFFCGEMCIPLEGRLTDTRIEIAKLFDAASFESGLPIECKVDYLACPNPYTFRIYDSKSALWPKVNGDHAERRVKCDRVGQDLHLSYFASFRHHVTAHPLQLAIVRAHSQDAEPIFVPLEGAMLADDPEGLHRCVQSVVANDFYSQAIDWGNGVIGFVVEQGDYRMDVKTTGFFIAAPEGGMEPEFLEDPLGKLRRALSERQVLRGLPMSDDDRNRLAVIRDEFMSDDEHKRECLKTYIENAANVAAGLGALDSINSFYNRIQNRDGKLAWVCGYVFMAGWWVKQFVDNEGDFRDWPFPHGSWHPLLIANKYIEAQAFQNQEQDIARRLVHKALEHFSRSYLLEDIPFLSCLADLVNGDVVVPMPMVPHEGQDTLVWGVDNNAEFVFGEDDFHPQGRRFLYYRFFKLLNILGIALDNWRRNPSLNDEILGDGYLPSMTVQDLRDYLTFVDVIDELIVGVMQTEAFMENLPYDLKLFLPPMPFRFCRRLIEIKAWKEYALNH